MNKLQLNWVSDKPVQEQVCDKLAVWIAELVRSSRVYRTPLKEPAGTAAHHQGANRHLSGGFVSRIFSPVLFDSLLTGAPVHKGREEWSMLKLCEEDGRGGSQQRLDIDPFPYWTIPSCAAEERDVSGNVWRRVTGCSGGGTLTQKPASASSSCSSFCFHPESSSRGLLRIGGFALKTHNSNMGRF